MCLNNITLSKSYYLVYLQAENAELERVTMSLMEDEERQQLLAAGVIADKTQLTYRHFPDDVPDNISAELPIPGVTQRLTHIRTSVKYDATDARPVPEENNANAYDSDNENDEQEEITNMNETTEQNDTEAITSFEEPKDIEMAIEKYIKEVRGQSDLKNTLNNIIDDASFSSIVKESNKNVPTSNNSDNIANSEIDSNFVSNINEEMSLDEISEKHDTLFISLENPNDVEMAIEKSVKEVRGESVLGNFEHNDSSNVRESNENIPDAGDFATSKVDSALDGNMYTKTDIVVNDDSNNSIEPKPELMKSKRRMSRVERKMMKKATSTAVAGTVSSSSPNKKNRVDIKLTHTEATKTMESDHNSDSDVMEGEDELSSSDDEMKDGADDFAELAPELFAPTSAGQFRVTTAAPRHKKALQAAKKKRKHTDDNMSAYYNPETTVRISARERRRKIREEMEATRPIRYYDVVNVKNKNRNKTKVIDPALAARGHMKKVPKPTKK